MPAMNSKIFTPGQMIARRYFKRHVNTWVQAARVVDDDEVGLLLWQAEGSDYLIYRDSAGRSIRDVPVDEIDARLVPTTWQSTSVLMLQPPAADYSVWWFFADGRFDGWYVNLESPYERWEHGIDTMDHALDLVVGPDRTVEWKDEDEFVARTGHPWYWSAAQAAEIRATAERLAKTAMAGGYPFDGTFCDFRPDPSWEPARLPAGWDRPRGG
jgi:hypothetical protein